MTVVVQQINFLIDEFRPRREYATSRQAFFLVAVVVMGLIALTTIHGFALARLHTDAGEATQQFAVLAETTQELKRAAAVDVDQGLLARVERLRADRATRVALLGLVGMPDNAQTRGFSAYFSDLARNTEPGIWLTRMHFGAAGARVELEGVTVEPAYVPAMLELLSSGDRFAGHRFDQFEIARREDGALQFVVTGPAKDKERAK